MEAMKLMSKIMLPCKKASELIDKKQIGQLTFKEKIHRLVTERSDLFTNVGEETSERLDHLIGIVENQAVQMETLQTERFELQREINELKK